MYNDYYLQEISGKITTTNNTLTTVTTNQETIIQNQTRLETLTGVLIIGVVMIIIYKFIERLLP